MRKIESAVEGRREEEQPSSCCAVLVPGVALVVVLVRDQNSKDVTVLGEWHSVCDAVTFINSVTFVADERTVKNLPFLLLQRRSTLAQHHNVERRTRQQNGKMKNGRMLVEAQKVRGRSTRTSTTSTLLVQYRCARRCYTRSILVRYYSSAYYSYEVYEYCTSTRYLMRTKVTPSMVFVVFEERCRPHCKHVFAANVQELQPTRGRHAHEQGANLKDG